MFHGLAPDGGLYIPEYFPVLPPDDISSLRQIGLSQLSEMILSPYLSEIPVTDLNTIIASSLNFPIPLIRLEPDVFLLEVFHGPTLAFKDVGARFMAHMIDYYLRQRNEQLTILVATSGDTGSAIAHAFHRVANVEVYVLYPSKKISHLQEQQMTTLGDNIHALEVMGTFDDCQHLVKKALMDDGIREKRALSTANSINIARLLPQIIYHSWGIVQFQRMNNMPLPNLSVPSGNFGNLTAAIYAHKMGVPMGHFIAATNINAIVPEYLATGKFAPAPSKQSYSNAMDVGNPSNFERLMALYDSKHKEMIKDVSGISVSDQQTLAEIRHTYEATNYILDPHTAVGVVAAREYRRAHFTVKNPVIVTATAHPAKFPEVIKRAINIDIGLPPQLQEAMNKTKQAQQISSDYHEFKNLLLR
jgi:threonine synthase